MDETNMRIWASVANTPKEAQKIIGAGRLKGMTDINPMFRIKRLTEIFGPVGFGWNTVDVRYTTKVVGNEELIFCELGLVYRIGDQWSSPVYGCGGNKVIVQERGGEYHNDEAYKMAYTDAISVACKSLGMCADIYFAADRTKYSLPEDAQKQAQQKPENKAPLTDRVAQAASNVDITTSEKVPQQKSPLEMMNGIISKLGISKDQFLAFRKQLIDDGAIINKPSDKMTQADWDAIGNAIISIRDGGK